MTEANLLDRLRSADRGDRTRAEMEFHALYEPRLRAVLSRIVGTGAELEDAIQEAFVDILRGLASFEGRAELGTWVYRVALRRGWKFVARERVARSETASSDVVERMAGGRAGADEAEARELARRLEEALKQLDFDQRNVIALTAVKNLAPAEIAKVLGVPVGTVHSRLSRARSRLREILGLRPD